MIVTTNEVLLYGMMNDYRDEDCEGEAVENVCNINYVYARMFSQSCVTLM